MLDDSLSEAFTAWLEQRWLQSKKGNSYIRTADGFTITIFRKDLGRFAFCIFSKPSARFLENAATDCGISFFSKSEYSSETEAKLWAYEKLEQIRATHEISETAEGVDDTPISTIL
ncbi:MAG TPA: hypothetical protein VMF62_12295 [Acetobacteraceae bacterium]|nr:hypothetical protein [Acetobacteraceae bacterium]